MRLITARNVAEAWPRAYRIIDQAGDEQDSRAGRVKVLATPVITQYLRPMERVLFCPVRDANPMFHLMEALWMLAGRRDATWLDLFVRDFSQRFGERGGVMYGAYGHRWRHWFEYDQLQVIVDKLKRDKNDRRVVLGMWDARQDLKAHYKDIPCNTHAYFRVVEDKLDITVCCRSNDVVWGCYGSNAVHFSVLQEYVAAMVGVEVGTYYQMSNNWHAYLNTMPSEIPPVCHGEGNPYHDMRPSKIVVYPEHFDSDLNMFFRYPSGPSIQDDTSVNRFFPDTAVPMYKAAVQWRQRDKVTALSYANQIGALDWKRATMEWMERRMGKDAPQSEL